MNRLNKVFIAIFFMIIFQNNSSFASIEKKYHFRQVTNFIAQIESMANYIEKQSFSGDIGIKRLFSAFSCDAPCVIEWLETVLYGDTISLTPHDLEVISIIIGSEENIAVRTAHMMDFMEEKEKEKILRENEDLSI